MREDGVRRQSGNVLNQISGGVENLNVVARGALLLADQDLHLKRFQTPRQRNVGKGAATSRDASAQEKNEWRLIGHGGSRFLFADLRRRRR